MRLLLASLLMILCAAPAFAQEAGGVNFYLYPEDIMRGRVDPQTGMAYEPPPEPNIPQVKFMQIEPAVGLTEKIDRLVEGVTVDIAPEYDHFGYEIRRYMASVGNEEVYKDPERRAREVKNIETAQIIFDYWMKDFRKKRDEIAAEIEAQNASSNLRTSFKYNAGVVNAFQLEMQAWLDHNKAYLKFLEDNKDHYQYSNKFVVFRDPNAVYAFEALFNNRDNARKQMNKRAAFANMVY